MKLLFLIFISILPIFLLGYYIYNKDTVPEPKFFIVKLFFCGVFAFFLAKGVGYFFNMVISFDVLSMLIYIFIRVALLEEFFKWIFLFRVSFLSKNFDQVYDMIVYSVFVSLGFACVENIFYVLDYGASTALYRAIFTIPAHFCEGVFMGYYLIISKAYYNCRNNKKMAFNTVLSILIPVLLHGFYDYCLFSHKLVLIVMFVLFIIYLYIDTFSKIKNLLVVPQDIKKRKNFCAKCGKFVDEEFCASCGNKNRRR